MKAKKKLLSVLAFATAVVVLMMSFTGCLGDDKDPVGGDVNPSIDPVAEKTAAELLAAAVSNTAAYAITYAEGKIGEVKLPSFDDGVTVKLALDGMEIYESTTVGAELELAIKDSLASLNVSASVNDNDLLAMSAASDGSKAVFESTELFGNGKYGFSLENFAENFKESALFAYLDSEDFFDGSLGDIVDQIVESVGTLDDIDVEKEIEDVISDLTEIVETFESELAKAVEGNVEKGVECEPLSGKTTAARATLTITGDSLVTVVENTFKQIKGNASLLNMFDNLFGGTGILYELFEDGEYASDDSISALDSLEEAITEIVNMIGEVKIVALVSESDLSLLTLNITVSADETVMLTVDADFSKLSSDSIESVITISDNQEQSVKIEITNASITVTASEYVYDFGDFDDDFDYDFSDDDDFDYDFGDDDDYNYDFGDDDDYDYDFDLDTVLQTSVTVIEITEDTAEDFELTITTTIDGEEDSVITVSYDRATGNYDITSASYGATQSIKGTLVISESTVKFALDSTSMSYDGEVYTTVIGLSVSVENGANVVEISGEYTDILSLDANGVQAFIATTATNISNILAPYLPGTDDDMSGFAA